MKNILIATLTVLLGLTTFSANAGNYDYFNTVSAVDSLNRCNQLRNVFLEDVVVAKHGQINSIKEYKNALVEVLKAGAVKDFDTATCIKNTFAFEQNMKNMLASR